MRKDNNLVHNVAPAIIAGFVALMAGCTRSDNPVGTTETGVPVTLTASFSAFAPGVPLGKVMGEDAADSIRIDSVVVVLAGVRFLAHVDSVAIDSMEHEEHGGDDDHGDDRHGKHDDMDSSVTLKGPFVLWIRDSLAIDFASQVVPAGSYDGVMFKIHRLRTGEKHENSDEHRHKGRHSNDSSVVGSSIVVWGAALKAGMWVPFRLASDIELEVKIRGNFVVPAAISSVRFALNFNLGMWFRDPFTGQFLDPTDPSMRTKELIKRAIRFAFGQGRCGRDHNGDGHPDN